MKKAITVAELVDLFPDPTVRKQIRNAVKKLPCKVMDRSIDDAWHNLESLIKTLDLLPKANSASVYRSSIRKLFKFGVD